VRIASSGRQHFPLAVGAPLSEFEAIAERYPVYRIDNQLPSEDEDGGSWRAFTGEMRLWKYR
jgi:hypothetical protein